MKRWLIPALVVLLMAPIVALATGTLTLPVTFGSLSAGVQNLSLFDQNFTAIRNYINTREITFGLLAARPAAGTSGRYYYATDTNSFFGDNGSAWVNLVAGAATGPYSVRGLVGANNSGTPLTKWDMSADLVALRSPTDGGISVRTTTGTLTNDTALAGPAANGRDQVAAFTGNTWLHFYFIWNGTTLATVSSSTAPPTGPALPTGYTAWAYAGFVRYGTASGGSLLVSRWRGSKMHYAAATKITSNANSTSEQTISIASAVAPNATGYGLWVEARDAAAGIPNLHIRAVSGSDYVPGVVTQATMILVAYFELAMPNIGQQFFYLWDSTPTPGASFSITNNEMPNGS